VVTILTYLEVRNQENFRQDLAEIPHLGSEPKHIYDDWLIMFHAISSTKRFD